MSRSLFSFDDDDIVCTPSESLDVLLFMFVFSTAQSVAFVCPASPLKAARSKTRLIEASPKDRMKKSRRVERALFHSPPILTPKVVPRVLVETRRSDAAGQPPVLDVGRRGCLD
jgi:hypothetical protein